jgi:intergrase/recombinase
LLLRQRRAQRDSNPRPTAPQAAQSCGGCPFSGQQFHDWLVSQGKAKRTVKTNVQYAKRFASILDTGDASSLATLPGRRRAKEIALVALANYAKFTGKYERFLEIKKRYALKWNECNSTQFFERFFNPDLTLDIMLQRIKEMIRLLPENMGKIIRFACLIGLRASEVVESARLLNKGNVIYWNPDRQALEHFRFPETFLRQTKKAYISFITKEQLLAIGILDCKTHTPSLNAITLACRRKGIKMDMHLCRKIFASWLRKEGIAPEIVDLLQGRVSQSILTRHYLAPAQSMKDDVLRALEKLHQNI